MTATTGWLSSTWIPVGDHGYSHPAKRSRRRTPKVAAAEVAAPTPTFTLGQVVTMDEIRDAVSAITGTRDHFVSRPASRSSRDIFELAVPLQVEGARKPLGRMAGCRQHGAYMLTDTLKSARMWEEERQWWCPGCMGTA